MKRLFFILSIFLLTSCKTISFFKNQKVVSTATCDDMHFVKNNLCLNVTLEDSINTNFMFDTGAMASAFIDSSLIKNFSNKKHINFGQTIAANGKKLKSKLIKLSLNSKLFESKEKIFSFINPSVSKCSKNKKRNYSGIIGVDFLFEDDMLLEINFTENKICNKKASGLNNLLSQTNNDYRLIKSKCNQNRIYVYLTINGKEDRYLLDTGNSASIIIPSSKKMNFEQYNKSEYLGSAYFTPMGMTDNKVEQFYDAVSVEIGNKKVNSVIAVSQSIKELNVGLEFIKGFDWIIDYNNNKVYCRKNLYVINEKNTINKNYFSLIKDEKIIIYLKEKSEIKYNIGDEITSVDNIKVTSENICNMQDLLNKTEDWNKLILEVIPIKN